MAPALWFDNIRFYRRPRGDVNVTIGSPAEPCHSLGLPPNTPVKNRSMNLFRRWGQFLPVAPNGGAIRWAENTVDGDAINLFDILPPFRLNDGDV